MHTVIKAYTLAQCMDIMAEYAEALEKQGGENLIFCEDRLTLLAERALTKRMGGTFRSSVSTFARLLAPQDNIISKQGSVMAVGNVMTRLQREGVLQCFTSVSAVGNNAKCIYETLAQFASSEITPQVLRDSAQQLEEGALKKKIADLACIYEGYTAFLTQNGYLDESRYLALLPERMRTKMRLKNVNVFFLGFTSFTMQALNTVRVALENAHNVIGIFCDGEEELYTGRAADSFIRVCNEYKKPQVLQLGKPLKGEAETLRKSLFDPENKDVKAVSTQAIRIYEAGDKAAEAEYVAVQIRRAMQENQTLRYRDISVLVSDIPSYSLQIKRALGEYDIPYFIDEKRSLGQHPFSLFLLDCLRVVKEKFSASSVQALTQNAFFGESDAYRNYLLKFANYRGGAKREIKQSEPVLQAYDLATLEDARARLLLVTQNIKARATGAVYCDAIEKIRLDFQTKQRLADMQERVDDVAQKGYLSQISRALDGVLKEMRLLTGTREMTVAEFAAILKDGLDATEISLIPLKTDAVFVGSIAESRIQQAHIVFAMGMTDDVPYCAGDTAIVSDKEIARLKEVQAFLEPTVAEVNLRTRESVALNLTAFTGQLHVSYPLSADGSEPALSDVFRYVHTCFCTPENKPIPHEKGLREADFAYRCSAPTPAIKQLLVEKNEYECRRIDTRKEYSSLYAALDKLSVTEKDDYLAEQGGHVRVERGEDLFFRNGKISPTTLEGYFACPFKNFVERGLRLKDREETAVLAVDTGNFIHELLERTTKEANRIETDEAMYDFAVQKGKEILQSPIYATQADTASGAFFADQLLKEGAQVAVAAFRQIRGSKFIVEETEKIVSTQVLNGKIDRVDGTDKFVRVIDYKTGSIDDSSLSYYTGRKLQMQLYMSAVKGERIPAGVFYFPASMDYAEGEEKRFQMKGFLNGDSEALLCGDPSLTEDKQSEFFPAALKNARSKRVMDETTFRDFLDYSVFVARQGAAEIKEGYIAPSPYGTSCEYCKYGGMCGFNRDACRARTENSIEPSAIAAIAREIRDGKEE